MEITLKTILKNDDYEKEFQTDNTLTGREFVRYLVYIQCATIHGALGSLSIAVETGSEGAGNMIKLGGQGDAQYL